jgi:hypothetical protein
VSDQLQSSFWSRRRHSADEGEGGGRLAARMVAARAAGWRGACEGGGGTPTTVDACAPTVPPMSTTTSSTLAPQLSVDSTPWSPAPARDDLADASPVTLATCGKTALLAAAERWCGARCLQPHREPSTASPWQQLQGTCARQKEHESLLSLLLNRTQCRSLHWGRKTEAPRGPPPSPPVASSQHTRTRTRIVPVLTQLAPDGSPPYTHTQCSRAGGRGEHTTVAPDRRHGAPAGCTSVERRQSLPAAPAPSTVCSCRLVRT